MLAHLKSVTIHEVGHTLGLTHNFRASTVYSEAQLADREFTGTHGISGSVMEYNAVNIALKGEAQGEYHMSTLGPYDYWAIEYGYRDLAPADEAAGLAKIAGRSNEPELAFMADDSLYDSGLDPTVNTFDLGADPLRFASRQLKLGRELWQLTESKHLGPEENYALMRRNFNRGLFEVQHSALTAVKYIGGLTLRSDYAGTGRAAARAHPRRQAARRAHRARGHHLLGGQLRVLARLPAQARDQRLRHRRLARDGTRRAHGGRRGRPAGARRASLRAGAAARARDRAAPAQQRDEGTDRKEALRLAELYAALHKAVFSELPAGADIPLLRRNLQREYVARLALVIVRPAPNMPSDARALLRADAQKLRDEMVTTQRRAPHASVETKAHLAESVATLDEALKASLVRQVL